VAAFVNSAVLAEDAVSIRTVRARGVSEAALRRELVAVPTPSVRSFVFVRRVTIRAGPQTIGRVMQAALAKLADEGRSEFLAFADFPALAVACARAALTGGLGTGWHWRTLGLSQTAGPGEAVGALLADHPLEAGAAVTALAEQGLLAPVWRDLTETVAARLTTALAIAGGFAVPAWPDEVPGGRLVRETLAASAETLLTRAAATWTPVLMLLAPRSEAVMAAAVLSLLRWSPGALRAVNNPVWPALLAHITGREPVARGALPRPSADQLPGASPLDPANEDGVSARLPAPSAEPVSAHKEAEPGALPRATAEADAATAVLADSAAAAASSQPRGKVIATGWGGVLFLINTLQRLDVGTLLAALGPEAPTGWRLLHDLGVAFGMPTDEPMTWFLAAQDLETTVPSDMRTALLDGIEALYSTDGPWPLPLAQPARLRATETHVDLELATTTVDLAVRLAGLDLDPGWVPWLGRVVAFHYDQMPTYQRRMA
jgi:hypothetical protein